MSAMSNETTLTIVGNLTADPELRYAPSGIAVANMTVASTPATTTARPGNGPTAKPCSCGSPPGANSPNTPPNPCRAATG
jgi:hypothetical protein